ncbi:hypothetical protein LVJ94_02935 [Pendulispora rubella]|uniref:Uncharacterized protein n=1 Tax=Pendulispora rubella TaxID=2741070 RepID=A0ABZ2L5Z8_9BACT
MRPYEAGGRDPSDGICAIDPTACPEPFCPMFEGDLWGNTNRSVQPASDERKPTTPP